MCSCCLLSFYGIVNDNNDIKIVIVVKSDNNFQWLSLQRPLSEHKLNLTLTLSQYFNITLLLEIYVCGDIRVHNLTVL